jgi:ribbon-helix-helix CopG family protein
MMAYTMMHRTQILLDDWQHQALKALAEARGRSLSDLIREIVSAHLREQPARAARRLSEISGVAEGPSDAAAEHDHYLYGWPKSPGTSPDSAPLLEPEPAPPDEDAAAEAPTAEIPEMPAPKRPKGGGRRRGGGRRGQP